MENKNNNKSNLLIYQKYLELIYYSNDIVRKYPKSETFALVKEIKSTIYGGLRHLLYAIKSSLYSGFRLLMYSIKTYNKQEKLKYLNEFDIILDILKVYIRLSYKYKYISMQNYQTWSILITDICNMLGGWINSCLKK